MLIEKFLPSYDVFERHETTVAAPPPVAYRAVRELDLAKSLPVLLLMTLRGLPHLLRGKVRPSRHLTIDDMTGLGFVVLAEKPPEEFVLGAVGRFWQLDSGIQPIEPSEFEGFAEPGYARAALNFRVEAIADGKSVVVTETRVACTDDASLRKFRLYWRAIGPFSALIRRLLLGRIKREAEARAA